MIFQDLGPVERSGQKDPLLPAGAADLVSGLFALAADVDLAGLAASLFFLEAGAGVLSLAFGVLFLPGAAGLVAVLSVLAALAVLAAFSSFFSATVAGVFLAAAALVSVDFFSPVVSALAVPSKLTSVT